MKANLRTSCVFGLTVAACITVGCKPEPVTTTWQNPLDTIEKNVVPDPDDVNYVLTRMEFARAAVRLGCPMRAEPKLLEAYEQLDVDRENTAAALSSEKYKYYKGETYERAMLCMYLGLIRYNEGKYNDARILFSRALTEDQKAVVEEDTPSIIGEDFALAYYWLSRAYAKLSQADNARIALRKANVVTPRGRDGEKELAKDRKEAMKALATRIEGETWAWETFHNQEKKPKLYVADAVNLAVACEQPCDPSAPLADAAEVNPVETFAASRDEFFTPEVQSQANLVLTIELGACPYKYLAGSQNERTEIDRHTIRPHTVRVYMDGHPAGEAVELLELWDQAATQDRIGEKDAAQTGKAIAKGILKQVPLIGGAAGYWDVSGDARYWTSLPGRVFVHVSKLTPGPHTARLKMFDINGKPLPRWTSTSYGIVAPAKGENVVLLNPRYDVDNTLPPELVAKAMDEGAKPIEE